METNHAISHMKKKPTTGTHCLPRQGGKRDALLVPAGYGHAAVGEKHGSDLGLDRRLLIRKSGGGNDIHPIENFGSCDLEEHHSGLGYAVVSPCTDGWHTHLKKACRFGGTAEGVDDLCCVRVHAAMLAQANVSRKPRLTLVLLG